MLAGVSPVQEAAAAVLLHHLSPREPRQFTEAVWAVDDGVASVALGVTQQEITVCEGAGHEKVLEEVEHHGGRKQKFKKWVAQGQCEEAETETFLTLSLIS